MGEEYLDQCDSMPQGTSTSLGGSIGFGRDHCSFITNWKRSWKGKENLSSQTACPKSRTPWFEGRGAGPHVVKFLHGKVLHRHLQGKKQ